MLPLSEIEKLYPDHLKPFKSFILREYLQYQILQILFSGPHAHKFCFLGGTCLRLIYQNTRFSEDLDFDNKDLSPHDFDTVALDIKRGLELLGLKVEIENVYKGAYHCYIKFPGLAYQSGLTGHKDQKILIQLDTENQGFEYEPNVQFINKFDVFCSVPTTPPEILLSQKFYAIFNRKQPKGRDFFDIIFLLSKNKKPDYTYLNMKMGIDESSTLRAQVLDFTDQLDFHAIADDVRAFLFFPADVQRVIAFKEFIKTTPL